MVFHLSLILACSGMAFLLPARKTSSESAGWVEELSLDCVSRSGCLMMVRVPCLSGITLGFLVFCSI